MIYFLFLEKPSWSSISALKVLPSFFIDYELNTDNVSHTSMYEPCTGLQLRFVGPKMTNILGP